MIGEKEALQLKKCQINGYKVPKLKSHKFLFGNVKVRSWKNQKNRENPNIQGNGGEMHQFPVILKPIWLSRRVEKLRNGTRLDFL